MKWRSLRRRLLALALVSTAGALALSGLGLVILFERHVEQRVDAELETYVRQIVGGVEFDPAGAITLPRPPADPRFDQPLSGLYWQIEDEARGAFLRSRSLWDRRLALPPDTVGAGAAYRHLLTGPGATRLIVRERSVIVPDGSARRRLRVAAAIDSADVRAATKAFAGDLAPALAVLGLALLAAAWLQVGIGLRPLEAVRRGLGAVRSGLRRRLPTDYPEEVMPLAEEVNDLLEAQDKTIARARASAADLAHGLKTPLTVLAVNARTLRARGEAKIAAEIEQLTETMRAHIERAIAKARLRRGRGAATALGPLIERLVATIRKTPQGERLEWETDISQQQVAVDADDLAELFGNILDNASKWARTRVRTSASADAAMVAVCIDDDGPGIPAAARRTVLERGARLDQTTAGSGLGLAIAGDVLEACGGALSLEDSPLGGLRAVVHLPSAPAPEVSRR